jgi:NAD(P)-dependent dehydrogenase (short-subunit alcohol dehydrogenase family)
MPTIAFGGLAIVAAAALAAPLALGLVPKVRLPAIVLETVTVKGPFFLVAAIAPAMAQRGSGAIVDLGSWIAHIGITVSSVYSSTKGALEALTRAWATEYGPDGVRVNAISPGASDESRFVHGTVIDVDGCRTGVAVIAPT